MQHYKSITSLNLNQPSAIAIGVFDGVHRGHRALIGGMVEHAVEQGLLPVVVTFDPHPLEVIKGPQKNFYLSLADHKADLLAEIGVEVVVTLPFDEAARQMRASDFLDVLAAHLSMRSLWLGHDFAMGYKREGNVDYLRAQASQRNYSLYVIDDVVFEGQRVSSSQIRARLAAGNVEQAERLLARPYELQGAIVEGERRGRTIGFPTANLGYDERCVVPANGVYVVWAIVDEMRYPAVVNVGYRPTFSTLPDIRIEAHLLDFQQDIYGHPLRLEFLQRLRDEQKFEDVDALITQINRDVEKARGIFAELPAS